MFTKHGLIGDYGIQIEFQQHIEAMQQKGH